MLNLSLPFLPRLRIIFVTYDNMETRLVIEISSSDKKQFRVKFFAIRHDYSLFVAILIVFLF